MKKFSRCALVLIIVTILSAAAGYIYEDKSITPMYTSTAKLIVTPGEENEASLRATNGGLINDFEIVLKSDVVISAAQKTAGTSENIADYLTVKALPNSNVLELTCTNPDQTTAKAYVDAVAKNASKITGIIPVKSIQVLEYGDENNVSVKPDLYEETMMIAGCAAVGCLFLELIVVFVLGAFKKPDDNSDDELEYERRYGQYAAAQQMASVMAMKKLESDDDEDEAFEKAMSSVAASIETFDQNEKKESHTDIKAEQGLLKHKTTSGKNSMADKKASKADDTGKNDEFASQAEDDEEDILAEDDPEQGDGFELEDDFEDAKALIEDTDVSDTGSEEITKKPKSSSQVIGIIKK